MKFIRILLLTFWGVAINLGGFAQKAVEICVSTDLKDAAKVSIIPLFNYQLYDIAKGNLDMKGQSTLHVNTKTPLLGVLKITTEAGRPLSSVYLYMAPDKQLNVTVTKKDNQVNPSVVFTGELKSENICLKSLPMAFISTMPGEKLGGVQHDLELKSDEYSCSGEFEDYMQKIFGTLASVKKISVASSDSKGHEEILKGFVRDLKNDNYWQSIPQWPNVLDGIFDMLESAQVIKQAGDGLSNRLKCIGDENLKDWYGIWFLQRWVNSRRWYEEQPIGQIEKLRSCFKTEAGKNAFEAVVQQYGRIEKAWGHLRNCPAPDFNFEDVNGRMVNLSSYRGKFVLLDVWNIYCGPCMDQVPFLKKYEPELEKMGVVVIGVSCDPQKIKDKWKNTVKTKQMPGIQVIMDNGRQSKFMKDYSIFGFPTFCLIGPDGVVINPYLKRPETPGFMQMMKQKIDAYNQKH